VVVVLDLAGNQGFPAILLFNAQEVTVADIWREVTWRESPAHLHVDCSVTAQHHQPPPRMHHAQTDHAPPSSNPTSIATS